MADVKVERREGGVVWLTIDRVEAMNALSGAVLDGILGACRELATDRAARVVVVTGAGEKAFSAGADLKERRGMDATQTQARIQLINDAFDALAALPQPTIAAINGVAFGGGLELALACDFRVAAAHAQLGLTEVRLGIMPGAGGTQRMTRLIGVARAKEMILLGRRVTAADAAAVGLCTAVPPGADLVAAVERLVAELMLAAPISLTQAKRAIDGALDLDLAAGLAHERACYAVTLTTEDRDEGLRAFAEKRPPVYKGR